MLNYVSANRDEDVFGDPFAFDPDRERNQQIAFGFGAHVCLGQHLARMEMRILMEELLPRLESLEIAGEPARVDSVVVGGDRKSGGEGERVPVLVDLCGRRILKTK